MKKIRLGVLLVAACLMMGCAANIEDGITYLEEEKYEEAIECFEKEIAEKKN